MTADPGQPLYYPLGYHRALDGLRACAVLPVMFLHGGLPGFHWGYTGVDLFFVISGYLITSILIKEHTQHGRISLIDFYRRRALRLFPALAALCIAVLLYTVLILRDPMTGIADVAVTAAYLSNWTRAFALGLPRYLGHTWSLSIEEQFYLVWPVLLILVLGRGATVRAVLRLVIILAIATVCWRVGLSLQGASGERIYNGTDTRADALLIGAALGLMLSTPAMTIPLYALGRRLWVLAVAILIGLPAILTYDSRPMLLGGYTVVALAAALVVAAALSDNCLSRALGHPALVWIGRRSYGLYLWHYPIMLIGLNNAIPKGLSLTVIETAGAFAFAMLSYWCIEQPFLRRRYRAYAPLNEPAGADSRTMPSPSQTTGGPT
jgi:peptidoglycan/LPS O-acetylase OafA/YrhL